MNIRVNKDLFIESHKDELKELVEIAKVQSTEASNKIEGIITTDDRLKNLVMDKQHREIVMNLR